MWLSKIKVNKIQKKLSITEFALNTIFSCIKLVLGLLTLSYILIADSVRSFLNLIKDTETYLILNFSHQDECHNYGHDKIKSIIFSAIYFAFLVLACYLFYKLVAFSLIYKKVFIKPKFYLIIVLSVIIILKYLLFLFSKYKSVREYSSQILHHKIDLIIALVVLLSQLLFHFEMVSLLYLSILSFIITSILVKIILFIKPEINHLLEKSLSLSEIERIRNIIIKNEYVKDFHKLKTRYVGKNVVISVHILTQSDLTLHQGTFITDWVESEINREFNNKCIIYTHLEPYDK